MGDVIVSIDGERTPTAEMLMRTLRSHKVGDVVMLGIKRDDELGLNWRA